MSEHSREHERVLAEILGGELDPESDRARGLGEECPECRARLETLRGVTRDLAQLETFRSEVLAGEATGAPDPALDRQVRDFFAESATPPAGARDRRRVLPLAIAAAALLSVAGLWSFLTDDDSSSDVLMGKAIEVLAPRDTVRELGRFRWRYALPRGGYFTVTVDLGDRVHSSGRLTGTEWAPEEKEAATWPRTLRWQVTAYRGSGEVLATSPDVSVTRSSP